MKLRYSVASSRRLITSNATPTKSALDAADDQMGALRIAARFFDGR